MTTGLTLDEVVARLLAAGAQLQLRHGIPPERVAVVLGGGPCPPTAGCAACGEIRPAICVHTPVLDDGPVDEQAPVVEIRAAS